MLPAETPRSAEVCARREGVGLGALSKKTHGAPRAHLEAVSEVVGPLPRLVRRQPAPQSAAPETAPFVEKKQSRLRSCWSSAPGACTASAETTAPTRKENRARLKQMLLRYWSSTR